VAQAASSDIEEILLVSTADGNAFIDALNLSNDAAILECSSIAVAGDSIFVVWEDRAVGNNEKFFAKGKTG